MDAGGAPGADHVVPHCSHHPERVAEGPCVRCGDYLCTECVATRGEAGELVCASCSPHVRATAWLPWDEDPQPTTFVRTVGAILLRPRETFSRMSPEPTGPAYGFAVVWWLLPAIGGAVQQFAALDASGNYDRALGTMCGTCLAPVFRAAIVTAVVALVVFGVAKMFGGKGRYSTDFRAVSYATPFYAVWEGVVVWLPDLLIVFMFPLLAVAAGWVGWLLMQSTAAHHRLDATPAAIAGYAPLSLLVLALCAGVAIGLAL